MEESIKKPLILVLIIPISAAFAVAGGGEEETPSRGNYEDGFYFAQAQEFVDSGWKSVVNTVWLPTPTRRRRGMRRPDAVSSVSIHVSTFLDLVEEALSDA